HRGPPHLVRTTAMDFRMPSEIADALEVVNVLQHRPAGLESRPISRSAGRVRPGGHSMRPRPSYVASLLATLAIVACAAAPARAQTVKTDYDKKTDFAKYKTFAFRKGTDAPTPFAQQRIENAVATQLKARGMSVGETPDLLV